MGLFTSSPADSLNEIASLSITIGTTQVESSYNIFSVSVKKEVNKLSRATVSILGGDPKLGTFEESEDTPFQPGAPVEISFGYNQTNSVVYKGIVDKQKISVKPGYHQAKGKNLLVIECVDMAVSLVNTYTTDIYESKSDSDIISTLLSKVSGLSKTVSTTSVVHDYLPKYDSNDWDFILNRAEANGMIILNSDNKITVSEPESLSFFPMPTMEITYGDGVIDFEGEVNSATQFSKLSYGSYDSFNEKFVSADSQEPSLTSQGQDDGLSLSSNVGPSTNEFNISNEIDSLEAKQIASAMLTKSRMSRLVGQICVKGVNSLDLGDLVTLSGFGFNFDGTIYITSLRHEFQRGQFMTWIGFGKRYNVMENKNTIRLSDWNPSIQGLHIGTVTKITGDPNNEYRVMVNIPAIKATGDGIWARLSNLYTTVKGGSFFIPELKSQVIVSFIANDIRQPVILGGLYTKKNSPYAPISATNDKKAIVTTSGMMLEFDDKAKKVTISSGKNSVAIDEKGITLLSDKNSVAIDANGITLTAPSNSIKLDGGGTTITASALNLKVSKKLTITSASTAIN